MCFACGRMGHGKDSCPHVICGLEVQRSDQQIKGGRKESREVVYDTSEEDGYGPWMVVSRKKTGPRQTTSVDLVTIGGSSSVCLVSPTKTNMDK